MAASASVRREIDDLIFKYCSGAGLVLGLLWAFAQPPATVKCASNTAGDVGRCMNDSMFAALMPYLVGLGVGTLMGAALGAFLIRVFRSRPKPRASGRSVSFTTRPSSPRAQSGGRWIVARFAGRCAGCRSSVAQGDPLLHLGPRRSLCRACADSAR